MGMGESGGLLWWVFLGGGWVSFLWGWLVVVVFWGLCGLACEADLNHLLRERF